MKKIAIIAALLLAVFLTSGCAGTSYQDLVELEYKNHPPIYAPKDAEANEPAQLIIIDDPDDEPLRTLPPATVPKPIKPVVKPSVAENDPKSWDVKIGRKWTHIIIHHSATDTGSAASFDRYHRDHNGWINGLAYHFVIGNGHGSPNGQIEVGGRWTKQLRGAHAGVEKYNSCGIGICLVGNFEKDKPTQEQIDALVKLISYLQDKCSIPASNVLGHRDIKATLCPGKNFPMEEVKRRIRE